MAATITAMSVLTAKSLSTSSSNKLDLTKSTIKPLSLLSLQSLPKGLITTLKSVDDSKLRSSITGSTLAGAVFAAMSSCDSALAAQQIATIAEGDNRGLALLLPIIPAILWVLYNILQPALNQIDRMTTSKGIIIGLGLGGLAASSFVTAPAASANEIAMMADATSDNRGLLVLFVVAPAIAWVLYNILQPALNQINRMKSP
ncbi:Photosystem ii core complex proteins psby protein [Thalictrum thalictroides]|uniref:Photosystem ii core complex proteins psby protein n=1 Tax=Thalictrum thalictroides TaxID=46969 RepID=A0A7J6W5Q6_THATH|nr:Photosystem ii core complex proteins psby protein [Thalictrum thalictroides]